MSQKFNQVLEVRDLGIIARALTNKTNEFGPFVGYTAHATIEITTSELDNGFVTPPQTLPWIYSLLYQVVNGKTLVHKTDKVLESLESVKDHFSIVQVDGVSYEAISNLILQAVNTNIGVFIPDRDICATKIELKVGDVRAVTSIESQDGYLYVKAARKQYQAATAPQLESKDSTPVTTETVSETVN